MSLPTLPLLASQTEEMALIKQHIRQSTTTSPVHILEAGCGSWCHLDLQDIPHHLTGIDLDAEAMAIRKQKYNDIHECIVGDLETVSAPAASYDVVYNSYVLEHIRQADKVLENFLHWLKPGGIIVIRVPDAKSVHGFITRVTPHWFHVLYYRYALGQANAGKPGYAPYPTHYHPAISREGMREFCRNHNAELLVEMGEKYYQPGKGLAKPLIRFVKKAVNLLSLGALSAEHTNLLYIIRKP